MGAPQLLLASTSPFRAELLRRLRVDFEQAAPAFDERAQDRHFDALGPLAFAEHLARGKADSLADAHPQAWILAADQLAVVYDGGVPRQLHKPGTDARAVQQLLELRGRSHELITAVVLRSPASEHQVGYDRHLMHMREFSRAEAEAYVALRHPVHSVGAYHIEDEGIDLFEAIEGRDYTGIIGLPLLTVGSMLRAAGLKA